MFCKLFDTKKHGQILVKLGEGSGDSIAEVRFYVEHKGLGICTSAWHFHDEETAWDRAEAVFSAVSEEDAVSVADSIMDITNKVT